MTTRVWLGGATAVTQVDTITFAGTTWDGSSTVTITLTNEGGGTEQETYSVGAGETDEQVRDGVLAVLNASSQDLFQAITWDESSTDVITGTAKVSGVPFYLAASDDDGTGSATRGASTANAGPHYWETAANWLPAAVPSDDDELLFSTGSISLLYGLRPGDGAGNQGGTSIDLLSLRVGRGFTGDIGQSTKGFFLDVDVSNESTGTPKVVFAGNGSACWLKGALDTVYVEHGIGSPNMLRLSGTIDNIFVTNPSVAGRIKVAAGSDLNNVFVNEAPGVTVEIDTSITNLTLLEATTGTIITRSGNSSFDVNIAGTARWRHDEGQISDIRVRGGLADIRGAVTIATAQVHAGLMDLSFSSGKTGSTQQDLSITTAVVFGGELRERNALANVTYGGGGVTKHGGQVNIDSGVVIALTR